MIDLERGKAQNRLNIKMDSSEWFRCADIVGVAANDLEEIIQGEVTLGAEEAAAYQELVKMMRRAAAAAIFVGEARARRRRV